MKIAMIRNIDPQGRIVIPAEIRRTMDLADGEPIEIETNGADILLRKYNAYVSKDEQIQKFLGILYSVIRCSAMVCTPEKVIATKGIFIPEGSLISPELHMYLQQDEEFLFSSEQTIDALENLKEPVSAIFPIKAGTYQSPNLALVLFCRRKEPLSDMDLGSARLVAATLAHHLP